jgi:hypothetical protein
MILCINVGHAIAQAVTSFSLQRLGFIPIMVHVGFWTDWQWEKFLLLLFSFHFSPASCHTEGSENRAVRKIFGPKRD